MATDSYRATAAEFRTAVTQVAEQMSKESWPPATIQPAMDFVLTDAADVNDHTVTSGDHVYHIDPRGGCPCKAAQYSTQYCKHTVALRMAERVRDILKGDDMLESNPQTEWETSVQNGDTSPNLFSDDEYLPEPDDIPEPKMVPFQEGAPHPDPDNPPETTSDPYAMHTVYNEGHTYRDYPSTLCIKRHINQTELSWTFRGENDQEVLNRVGQMLRKLDAMAARHAPPMQAAPAPGPPPQQQAMPGQLPMCPVHQAPMKVSNYGGHFCTRKNPDGTHCNQKAP